MKSADDRAREIGELWADAGLTEADVKKMIADLQRSGGIVARLWKPARQGLGRIKDKQLAVEVALGLLSTLVGHMSGQMGPDGIRAVQDALPNLQRMVEEDRE